MSTVEDAVTAFVPATLHMLLWNNLHHPVVATYALLHSQGSVGYTGAPNMPLWLCFCNGC